MESDVGVSVTAAAAQYYSCCSFIGYVDGFGGNYNYSRIGIFLADIETYIVVNKTVAAAVFFFPGLPLI